MTKGIRVVNVTRALLDESLERPMKTDLPDDIEIVSVAGRKDGGARVTCQSAEWPRLELGEVAAEITPKLTLRSARARL